MHSTIPPPHHQVMPSRSGFQASQPHACPTLDFAKLVLSPGQTHQGETGGREVLLLALSGEADVTVNGHAYPRVGQRSTVFAGTPHGLYLPRCSAYTVTARTAFEAALPSAVSDLDTAPYEIHPADLPTYPSSGAAAGRWYHELLGFPGLGPTSRLRVVEIHTTPGPYRVPLPPTGEFLRGARDTGEQMTYFRLSSRGGRGLARHYSARFGHGYDELYTIYDHSLLTLPHGECTYSLPAGVSATSLWVLAAEPLTPVRRPLMSRWASEKAKGPR